ncbi:MAG TPA: methyltransferase [bacterium]|nr:methyltransferase [bacterium]
MNDQQPTPEKVMRIVTGGWACSILGSAVIHSLFRHLEGEGLSAKEVSQKSGISGRGAQALLDGLLGLGLIDLKDGRYRNTPDASTYLVEGKPTYLGGMAKLNYLDFERWSTLAEAVKSGAPQIKNTSDTPENPYWEMLVPSIAALSFPVAQMAADRLGLAKAGPVKWLDIGGGSGIYSAVWLGLNRQATGFQLDWPNVNRIARDFVGKFGVADRFKTIDGDFHTARLDDGAYDFLIYSHIAHQETPESNLAVFKKFRKALKPGGTLVISDFVVNDDRTAHHPFALMFYSVMLLQTPGGATYRQSDYRNWLKEADFKTVSIEPTPTPATLIFAQ